MADRRGAGMLMKIRARVTRDTVARSYFRCFEPRSHVRARFAPAAFPSVTLCEKRKEKHSFRDGGVEGLRHYVPSRPRAGLFSASVDSLAVWRSRGETPRTEYENENESANETAEVATVTNGRGRVPFHMHVPAFYFFRVERNYNGRDQSTRRSINRAVIDVSTHKFLSCTRTRATARNKINV